VKSSESSSPQWWQPARSAALGRLFESRLVGLRAADPPTLAGASLLLLAVVVLAGYVPARRAKRVDPMAALRIE
jgi:putative ABC transport system permease protein